MPPVRFCQNFALDVVKKLWKQRESRDNEKLCDVVLIVGTEEMRIPAHSCVLSAASKYFDRMFMEPMPEGTTKEVKMPDVDCDILQILVQYCYTGLVEISQTHAVELLKTAEMLLLRNVVTICATFLAKNLHPNNCLGIAILAEQYRCEKLLHKAKAYSLEHFIEVSKTDEFLNQNAEQLGDLLASNLLNISSEEEVFNGLKGWIDFNRIEREEHQVQLLKFVRLPLLGKSFLREHVKPLCISTDSLEIYVEALELKLSQQYIEENERNSVKRRKSNEFLIRLAERGARMDILYRCPQKRKWMKWSNDLNLRWYPGIGLMDGNLFLVGGHQSEYIIFNTIICLNLRTMTLTDVTPMIEYRRWCGAAILNGCLYAVGGCNKNGNNLNSVEKLNPITNTWSKVASMTIRRSSFGTAIINEKLYAVGGLSIGNYILHSAERYDPLQNVWMPIAPMHEARFSFGIAVSNGLLYAVGGKSDIRTVERYNPKTNRWSMLCRLKDNLTGLQQCTTYRDRVIVFYNNRAEEYDEETNEWKTNASLNVLLGENDVIFTYSGELLTSAFD